MNKILYMTLSEHLEIESGVNKKINSQVNALEKLGHIVHLSGRSKDGYVFLNKGEPKDIIKKKDRKSIFNKIFNYLIINNIKILYMRKITVDYYFLAFLRLLKDRNIRIYIEIPTYPYDREAEGIRQKIVLLVDKLFRNSMQKYVYKIVTFTEDDQIFGIPCINISNGIGENEFQYGKKIDNTLFNFVSVSAIRNWHGIDRFLRSLSKCEPELRKKIKFHVVGPKNQYYTKLVNMVDVLDIKENVKFYGYLNSDQLVDLYKICQFGVGSLGRHRSGIEYLSSLKNREYAAKGLYIIYSEKDLDFDQKPFVHKVSADDKEFLIEDIIKEYVKLNIVSDEIVKFSEKFSWIAQMKKISLDIENIND